MAKLKELKETCPEWFKSSIFDMLVYLDPSKTNKFIPMMINVLDNELNNRLDNEESIIHIKNHFLQIFPYMNESFFDNKENVKIAWHLIRVFESNSVVGNNFRSISDFTEFYLKGYINNVDSTKIKTISEVELYNSMASINSVSNEYEKQIHVLLNDDKWLVLTPLTYEASTKYGASTRWCTAAKNDIHQYFRYTDRGLLIYCLNKETGYKVAMYYHKEDGISFWNAKDNRIDSIETELDGSVFDLLKKSIKLLPNTSKIDTKVWEQSRLRNQYIKDEPISEAQPMRGIRVNDEVEVGYEYEEAGEMVDMEMTYEQVQEVELPMTMRVLR
jgi:hypothetical protein